MISITILTKDSARLLAKVLESVRAFDEVVVLDSGSSDTTLEIAAQFPNVRSFRTTFKGFGPLHNEASDHTRHEWVFSLDSDEVMSDELVRELKGLSLDKESVYSVPVHNFYNGRFIRWCGWYPDRHVRLYHRGRTRFSDAQVHEAILLAGMREVSLASPLRHYSYEQAADFLTKMQRYSDLFAREQVGRKRCSTAGAVGHGLAAFLRSYVLKRGFLGGREGFIISVFQGHLAFWKYVKLQEANERRA
jgi:glycosyltransferase involved in cell wall biosynthesis